MDVARPYNQRPPGALDTLAYLRERRAEVVAGVVVDPERVRALDVAIRAIETGERPAATRAERQRIPGWRGR